MGRGSVVPALVGQGQQLAGLTPEVQLISDAHCKFLPPCRTRQKPREQTYPDSYPPGRQCGGYVASLRAFAQVNARSPTRERFLPEPLVGGSLRPRCSPDHQPAPRSTTPERTVRVAGCPGRPRLSAGITWAKVSPSHVCHGLCMKHAALVIPIALLSLATGCSNNSTTGSSSVRRRDLRSAADPAAGLG